ncbi:hypothetical protein MKW98_005485 [Papaver atlanticum]|uniref:N-acetyltransferase domain-containing protein n=1 Tax=Papaver atlanticum TaxID=357466 RepID=A0AAD4XQC3_9MAGN|nr:hypothetical protein MKW98_005485 [Papaver atlanticum]
MEETMKEEEEEAVMEEFDPSEIDYVSYGGEHHLPLIMRLVDKELSEPYSIFTYRYFVYLWPQLSFLAFHKGNCIGTVVCKMGEHRNTFRGYIAMLVVIKSYRGKGIATELVTRSIQVMMESGCEEVTLEAEVSNKGALALYGRLGFIRAKRLFRKEVLKSTKRASVQVFAENRTWLSHKYERIDMVPKGTGLKQMLKRYWRQTNDGLMIGCAVTALFLQCFDHAA